MTSWGGNRSFAPQKKQLESVSFFQTTEGGICSNFNLFFLAYLNASRNAESLYVHDVPNSVSQNMPLFQTILKENSTIKYLKDVSPNSSPLKYASLGNNQFINSTNFQTLKRIARDLFFYNNDTQEKIITRIRSAGLERTPFDVGVHIRSGDKITTGEMKQLQMSDYLNALQMFSKRLGKSNLSIFVMTDNMKMFQDLKLASPTSWTYITLQELSPYTMNGHNQDYFNTLPPAKRMDMFYQFLTELHIMQNTPNIVVTYSSNIGRFLYLTSRFTHTSDTAISVDVPKWSLT